MSEWKQLDIEEWISLQEDSPVSPTVSQESKIRTTIANSGLKCLELSKKSNPPTSLERMSEILLASEEEWYSSRCVLTWKVKATKCRRLYYLLQQSTHRIKDTGVGLWPTPDANMGNRGTQPKWTKNRPSGHHAQYTINQAVRDNPKMWPTPRANDSNHSKIGQKSFNHRRDRRYFAEVVMQHEHDKKMFLTPSANEDAAGRVGGKMQKMLGNSPEVRNTGEGTLSAEWVELLMGYPKGWTDIGEMDGKKVRQELPKGKKTEPTDLKD